MDQLWYMLYMKLIEVIQCLNISPINRKILKQNAYMELWTSIHYHVLHENDRCKALPELYLWHNAQSTAFHGPVTEHARKLVQLFPQ